MIQTREAYDEAIGFMYECMDDYYPEIDELVTLLIEYEEMRYPNFYQPFVPASGLKKEKPW